MNAPKVTLFIQKSSTCSADDDIISIYETADYSEMFRIVYQPGEFKERKNQFYMSRHVLANYVSDTLRSLSMDCEPFEHVQVSTAHHPSVLYHTSDLEKRETRHMIEDMIMTAVRLPIEKVKISK